MDKTTLTAFHRWTKLNLIELSQLLKRLRQAPKQQNKQPIFKTAM
jgi:hypothetical protein